MENKNVGFLVLGIAIVLILIVFLFNNAVMESVRNSCYIQHGDIESCEMYDSVNYQKYFALGIVGVLLVIGFVLIFTKQREKIILKKIKEKRKKIDLAALEPKEREVVKILDKLEAKQLIERKRRGMNNIVVLRN